MAASGLHWGISSRLCAASGLSLRLPGVFQREMPTITSSAISMAVGETFSLAATSPSRLLPTAIITITRKRENLRYGNNATTTVTIRPSNR